MRKVFIISFFLLAVVFLAAAIYSYSLIMLPSVKFKPGRDAVYLPSGSGNTEAFDSLGSALSISHPGVLRWLASAMKYQSNVKPGKYSFKGSVSNYQLVGLLRSGKQTPVKVTFNNIRNIEQLAGRVGKKLEADSAALVSFFSHEGNYASDGFNKATIISLFIPDTYEFYWNTDANGFYDRMYREYKRFWNDERKGKAENLGLNPAEVSILASIIDDEVAKGSEKPRIAGVYLNRLKRGIPLQACPTIKFALNDFSLTRILYKHLETESPYNTYKHQGLPPGPVGCPSREGLEAVLNAEKHDYLFFVAKADFSGYHNFSRTLAEHNRYANKYQRELDRRGIYK